MTPRRPVQTRAERDSELRRLIVDAQTRVAVARQTFNTREAARLTREIAVHRDALKRLAAA